MGLSPCQISTFVCRPKSEGPQSCNFLGHFITRMQETRKLQRFVDLSQIPINFFQKLNHTGHRVTVKGYLPSLYYNTVQFSAEVPDQLLSAIEGVVTGSRLFILQIFRRLSPRPDNFLQNPREWSMKIPWSDTSPHCITIQYFVRSWIHQIRGWLRVYERRPTELN